MRTCWIAHVFEYCCQKSVVLQNSPNALPRSWSVCVSYVQMSGVAPKQPHDAPKCGLDERNWVCGLKWSSYYSGSYWKRKSMCIINTHWNTFIFLPHAILNIEMYAGKWGPPPMINDILVFVQNGDDGAAHPVVWPVCHAGGDGCLHCSEEGIM